MRLATPRGAKDRDFMSSGGVATINDVAKYAEVSIKTVSRVMNDEPNVREETRAKVREVANRLQYRPNLLARSLAGSRSFLIGLLHDNPVTSYVYDLQMGAIERCREDKYHVLSEPLLHQAGDLEQRISSLLATIRLDGVILTPPLCDMNVVLQTIEAAGVPYVRIAPYHYQGQSASVGMDDSRAAYEMTRHLLGLGHRDIGFVLGHPDHGASHPRFDGFQRAMADAGLVPRPEWIKPGRFDYESGVEAGKALFAASQRPTAIFASNDLMAFGVIAEAHEAGVGVPDDVSVVGFDDNPGATLVWPHLTTIHQPVKEMAWQAGRLLMELAAGKMTAETFRSQDVMLDFALVSRLSTAAPKKA